MKIELMRLAVVVLISFLLSFNSASAADNAVFRSDDEVIVRVIDDFIPPPKSP